MVTSQSERSKRRRQVLQAAVGVPAMLTLPNGAAAAVASLTCADKSQALAQSLQTTSPVKGLATSADTDTWMRYSVQGLRILIPSGNGSSTKWVPGFKLGSAYYEVLLGSNGAPTGIAESRDLAVVNGNGKTNQETDTGKFYYLLVDYAKYSSASLNTPEVFVYPANVAASPIAGASCWNSLMGTHLSGTVIN